MVYTTERIQKIVKSPAGRDILNEVSPIYGEGRVALWLFQVIGAELDNMIQWTEEMGQQVVPHTATWSLDYWEDEYNLPRDPSLSTATRRERIISYMRNRAPMNPYKLSRIASSVAENAEVRVEERTGGGSLFTVWISAFPADTDKAKILAAIDRAKPARLSYEVKYEQYDRGFIYSAGYMQMSYDITMKQVV